MAEYDKALAATIDLDAVQGWITHAKFHAESDDRGYPAGRFDWQRFHAALSDLTFKPCCGIVHYVAEIRVRDLISIDWWHAYREAMLAYVTTYIDDSDRQAA